MKEHQTRTWPRELVLAVNELFHDIEGKNYVAVHPEIFAQEPKRWKQYLGTYVKDSQAARTFVDLGSGTGFVGEQMGNTLHHGDTMICADLSQTMLDIATKKLRLLFPSVHIEGVKLIDETLPFPTASIDVITMNSVLHHIPHPAKILDEISRVLQPHGILFIGHEPNIRYIKQRFFPRQASVIHALIPQRIIAKICRALHILPATEQKEDVIGAEINSTLQQRGLITKPLTRGEIEQLVDIHSPSAGGVRREEGFDPWNVLEHATNGFVLASVETYNHLGKISGRYRWLQPYERLLKFIAPRSGSSFFLVARKKEAPLA